MTRDRTAGSAALAILLRHDLRRLRSALRHPSAGGVVAAAIPLLLLGGVLIAAADRATPALATPEDAALLATLLSAPVAFLAYEVLFRGRDEHFLRTLGLPLEALFWSRTLRLCLAAMAVLVLALLPPIAAGVGLGRFLAIATGALAAAWSASVSVLALAARAVSRKGPRGRFGVLALGMWDRDLADIAPLVHAPLVPLVLGGAAGLFVGISPAGAGARALITIAAALVVIRLARPAFVEGYLRFAPRAQEMTFVEPPVSPEEALRVGRGVAGLLPRRAAAVWARDGAVGGRRYPWATRLLWPVGLVSLFALARWGDDGTTRAWIAVSVLMALLMQGIAIASLGAEESRGRRWIDRSLGIRTSDRLLGRWCWGWGLSLWLLIPVAIAWTWWARAPGAWLWPFSGAVTAGIASLASLTRAGWR